MLITTKIQPQWSAARHAVLFGIVHSRAQMVSFPVELGTYQNLGRAPQGKLWTVYPLVICYMLQDAKKICYIFYRPEKLRFDDFSICFFWWCSKHVEITCQPCHLMLMFSSSLSSQQHGNHCISSTKKVALKPIWPPGWVASYWKAYRNHFLENMSCILHYDQMVLFICYHSVIAAYPPVSSCS